MRDLKKGADPVLVSACLLGIRCRWDGGSRPAPLTGIEQMIPVCPEVIAGFGVPRPAIEHDDAGRIRVVETGEDVTALLSADCDEIVDAARAAGVRRAVLKQRSPSCGSAEIYVGGTLRPGQGLLTRGLRAAGIAVTSDPSVEAA